MSPKLRTHAGLGGSTGLRLAIKLSLRDMIRVAIGLTVLAIISTRETVVHMRLYSLNSRSGDLLTDIAVDVELDVRMIRPYDGVDTEEQILEEEPEA